MNNRINSSSSSSSSNNVFIYVLRRVNIIVIPLILTVHETVVIYMEDGGMECWVVEKGKGGVGFDFNDEVREIVCRTVKLNQTRKNKIEG